LHEKRALGDELNDKGKVFKIWLERNPLPLSPFLLTGIQSYAILLILTKKREEASI